MDDPVKNTNPSGSPPVIPDPSATPIPPFSDLAGVPPSQSIPQTNPNPDSSINQPPQSSMPSSITSSNFPPPNPLAPTISENPIDIPQSSPTGAPLSPSANFDNFTDQTKQPTPPTLTFSTITQANSVPPTNPLDFTSTPPQTPGIDSPEPAPTDLSQLTENTNSVSSSPADIYTPQVSAPETLVVPSTPSSTPTTVTTQHRRILPVLALVGGIIVVLIVAGASAYFILGIGRPSTTQSLPIVQQPPLTNPPPQAPTPPALPAPTTAPPADGSSSFGELNNGESGSNPDATQGPTSAADLIRARSQQTSPSPSPQTP